MGGHGLDLGPKGREMDAIIHHQGGKPQVFRAIRQDRQAQFESRVRKPAPGIHADNGITSRRLQHRFRRTRYLARLQGAQDAFDPVDAMRLAAVAFARRNDTGQGRGLALMHSRPQKDPFDPLTQRFDRYCFVHRILLHDSRP